MPRRAKPFLFRNCWYTDVGGQRTLLASGKENRKEAEEALYELLSKRASEPESKSIRQIAVWELCDKFLEWVELHRAKATFDDYRFWLTRWVKLHGKKRLRDIRALVVIGIQFWTTLGIESWTTWPRGRRGHVPFLGALSFLAFIDSRKR